jgi:single-strand DNA-binding protein
VNGIACNFHGRLGRDPELRYRADGRPLCNLSVGVPDGKGGLEWVRVTVWEEQAEAIYEQLEKGVDVVVEGRLKLAEWDGADGQRHAALNVSAWKVEVVGRAGRPTTRRAAAEV